MDNESILLYILCETIIIKETSLESDKSLAVIPSSICFILSLKFLLNLIYVFSMTESANIYRN
ncbi:unnamed protein product [Nezara viridula]|uniref:Uncharacterized protein n=1 Tax=Nezara viridula TaxID=85310 RepID=A0A9P0MRX3_NEZVI|nr:unnamed protein product [Nezara viridula]CAH1400934.1 unnamed protein product [Nezara viridula]